MVSASLNQVPKSGDFPSQMNQGCRKVQLSMSLWNMDMFSLSLRIEVESDLVITSYRLLPDLNPAANELVDEVLLCESVALENI